MKLSEPQHACRESNNPRNAGRCDCGLPVPKTRRILEVEREFTRAACRGYVDPSPLIEHAERRSLALSGEYVANPMEIRPGMDRVVEVLEELADARNHLVFCAQENLGDEAFLTELRNALSYIAIAYDRLSPR